MPLLNIDLMTPNGILFEGNEIPDDLQSAELVSRLVNTLGLPRATAGGEPIYYSLEIVNQGVRLHGGQTLGDAGAANGDVIRLVSSHKIQRPTELQPPPMPVVSDNPSADEAHTTSPLKGAVIIIPVRDPNTSVTKILGGLKASLGVRTEEVSVLNPSTSKLYTPVSARRHSWPAIFGKYRLAMLAGMAVISCLFLIFAISSKDKTEPVAQAMLPPPAPTTTAVPVETIPQPAPEPTPEARQEPRSLRSSLPVRRRIVKSLRVVKPTPVLNATVDRPAAPVISATVDQPKAPVINATANQPKAPKKCGLLRKIFVGCENRQPQNSKTGGAVGVAQSAAEAKARTTIRRGVQNTIP